MTDPNTAGGLVAAVLATAGDAAIRNVVGEAVKDAYHALKHAVARWAAPDVEALVKEPKSQARRAVVAEIIDRLSDEDRATLLSLAYQLNVQMRPHASDIGIDIADIKKLDADIQKIAAIDGMGLRISKVKNRRIAAGENLKPAEQAPSAEPPIGVIDRGAPWCPKIHLPPDSATTLETGGNRFQFTSGRTEFLGRETEMARLQQFLRRASRFSWWLVAGSGGMGKSRLALEFCRAVTAGWDCGFLPLEAAQRHTEPGEFEAAAAPWEHWQPDRPTLIVVDYLVERAGFLGNVIRLLAARKDLAHPVRLLLLERDAEGRLWQPAFKAPDSTGQSWMDGSRHADPLKLAAPNDEALWRIIVVMSNGKAENRTELLDQLRRIDPQTRPLFAAFLGDALANDEQPRRWDRATLLTHVLRRDFQHFWQPGGITPQDQNLLCLATLTGGAHSSWLDPETFPPDHPIALPALDDPGLEHRYLLMAGLTIAPSNDGSQSGVFLPLQPDLLGEFFVLHHLAPTTRVGSSKSKQRKLTEWVNAAWRLNAVGTAIFLGRLGADFPEHPAMACFFELPPIEDLFVRVHWAILTVNEGVRLGELRRYEKAIAVYDEVLAQFGRAPEPALCELVAKALVNKGDMLDALGRYKAAIAVYDKVLARFGDDPEPALRQLVAKALLHKGITFGKRGLFKDTIAIYDEMVARFGDAPEPAVREQVARALVYQEIKLSSGGRHEAAIAVCDEMLARFIDDPAPALRELVAMAIHNKGSALSDLGRNEAAIMVCDDVVARFGDALEPVVREQVAMALVNKGFTLGALSRFEDAVAVCDEMLARFGDAREPAIREQVSRAHYIKKFALRVAGRGTK
jgi:tetratricopeptide (TPR) repeat protein